MIVSTVEWKIYCSHKHMNNKWNWTRYKKNELTKTQVNCHQAELLIGFEWVEKSSSKLSSGWVADWFLDLLIGFSLLIGGLIGIRCNHSEGTTTLYYLMLSTSSNFSITPLRDDFAPLPKSFSASSSIILCSAWLTRLLKFLEKYKIFLQCPWTPFMGFCWT